MPEERHVFHIATRVDWESSDDTYVPTAFAVDGFIHCSNADQVEQVAKRFFVDQSDLLLLEINVSVLNVPLRDETSDANPSETFPHVYGPINKTAVVKTSPFPV